MERTPPSRGDTNKISGNHVEVQSVEVNTLPLNPERESPAAPPLTFAEAERRNAFALLTQLHDHALGGDAGPEPLHDATHHLTELALAAAVVAWWTRWQPTTMHRALVAGTEFADVTVATGLTEAEAYARWSNWADRQSDLIIAGRPAIDAEEVAAIRRRFQVNGDP
jgi:hypothetical protein